MIKNYIVTILAVFLLASCETTGGSSGDAVPTNSYATGESSMADLQSYLQNEIGDRVYFDTNKHNVNASAAFILEAQANWLKATPGFTVILEGHCDERGTRDYNLALGERRANSIKEFLISLGVDGSRLQTISYGKERPAAEGSTSEAWAENRRVVTIIGE
ncbi:peptidoglycan-associated lipoprotein Pal [Rickettsiales bacterium]|nr:peptidoglycan-associated lipoprotein Pal [Rickettsiales bacterium]